MWNLIGVVSGLVLGFCMGMLVMRNNYKKFVVKEAGIREMLNDPNRSNASIVVSLKNLFGI